MTHEKANEGEIRSDSSLSKAPEWIHVPSLGWWDKENSALRQDSQICISF